MARSPIEPDADEGILLLSFAENIDAKWLAGKGQGTSIGSTGRNDYREVIFKEDGTWTGENQSARLGLITQAGKYTIEGERVILEGTIQSARRVSGSPWATRSCGRTKRSMARREAHRTANFR